MSDRRRLGLLAVALQLVIIIVPGPALAASGTVSIVSAGPLPITPDGDGVRDEVVVRYRLQTTATVSTRVLDFDGRTVRTFPIRTALAAGTYSLRWGGRDDGGLLLPNAAYRVRVEATDSSGTTTAEVLVTKANRAIYPRTPGSIVIALDPGHGGPDPGAVSDGTHEADINLDVARRLRAMLAGAGVGVVMTRDADVSVNRPVLDRNLDGEISERDELAARLDVANLARADLFVVIHQNSASDPTARGTETWTSGDHAWIDQNLRFAALVQAELVSGLRAFATSTWSPVDRGVKRLNFYVTAPYEEGRVPRPGQMPTILGESLFLSNAGDRAKLRSAAVRQAIAEGYYDAIARYLAERSYGARYAVLAAPASLVEGAAGTVSVAVRNTGNASWPAGTYLYLRYVPAVPYYDGAPYRGTALGPVSLTSATAPGARVDVALRFTAPAAGRWILKVDLRIGDLYLSDAGVVQLQVPFRSTAAPT